MTLLKTDLERLLGVTAQTAVSIYAPTSKTHPENLNDRITVKNKISSALSQIQELGPKRDFDTVIENLNAAFDSVDWDLSSDGIAIFASEQGNWVYRLNHSPKEQIVISDQFVITGLVKTLNESWEYYLLVLSESPTRLFKGTREELIEIKGGFPIEHAGRGGASAIPTAFGQQTSVILDEEHRKFFRKVSEEFTKVKSKDSLPIVVVGVERFLSFWEEVAPTHLASAQIRGSYDFMSDSELMTLSWPTLTELFQIKGLEESIQRLNTAIGNNTYAGGFQEVVEMAKLGRVSTLVVSSEESTNPLTEVAIRSTLAGGGEVTFLPIAELEKFAEIAADLRF